jgi:transposase
VIPDVYREKAWFATRKGLLSFIVHIDNSMSHYGAKIAEKLGKKHIARAPHPPYSPDLSPCDFWLFGILKDKIKERLFWSGE